MISCLGHDAILLLVTLRCLMVRGGILRGPWCRVQYLSHR